jgi:nicotinamide riboside kinase
LVWDIALKIALLGAESTGKSELANRLSQHFQHQDKIVVSIPEYLRTWCDTNKRTPRADEQRNIAVEQARQISAAVSCDFLIADTTPLMTAVYSDLLFKDASLYDMALSHQRNFDATLLMGLDLPWVADGIQRDGLHTQEPVDHLLRAALIRSGINFQVVYGVGEARLQNALRCLNIDLDLDAGINESEIKTRPQKLRNWVCERCSDPECEHRLFTALLNQS